MTEHFAPAAQTQIAVLDGRGVVRVGGPEAEVFLQGLVTNDVVAIPGRAGRYAALLTPQGKILFDFLIARDHDGALLVDCARTVAADLAKRLGFYKLRAKVEVADRSEELGVFAAWGDGVDSWIEPGARLEKFVAFADPRHPALGWRVIAPHDRELPAPADADYEVHRISLGVPSGGVDFAYGDTFPHEANLDRLNGVDFRKGCYVGQEVVSRVQHRGTARKRIVPVMFDASAPAPGTEVFAGEVSLGHMGSSTAGRGLAMLRLDRVEDAARLQVPVIAATTPLRVVVPAA